MIHGCHRHTIPRCLGLQCDCAVQRARVLERVGHRRLERLVLLLLARQVSVHLLCHLIQQGGECLRSTEIAYKELVGFEVLHERCVVDNDAL